MKLISDEERRLRTAARQKVYQALKAGEIRKPKRCRRCKAEGEVWAYHRDFSEPLEVKWLCKACHQADSASRIGKYKRAFKRRVGVVWRKGEPTEGQKERLREIALEAVEMEERVKRERRRRPEAALLREMQALPRGGE